MFHDDDFIPRDPAELPVKIEMRWFKAYSRRPFDDFDDYEYVVTWADGSVDQRDRIPNGWQHLVAEPAVKRLDATLAKLNAEHRADCIGGVPVNTDDAAAAVVEGRAA